MQVANKNGIDVTVVSRPDGRGYVQLKWTRPGAGPSEAHLQTVVDWARATPTFPGARRLGVAFAQAVR